MSTNITQGDRCAASEHCMLKLPDQSPGFVQGNRHRCPGPNQDMTCNKAIHPTCGFPIRNPIHEFHANLCYDCASKAPVNSPDQETAHSNQNTNTNDAAEQNNPSESSSSQQQQRPVVNSILAGIRERMNLETVKRKTRAPNTFYKHQLENVRFIMWLYKSSYKRECLVPELITDLDRIQTDYVFSNKYVRRIRKLPEEVQKERKAKCIYTAQTDFLKSKCLNQGGLGPLRETVYHEKLTDDIYGTYLCERRKEDGALYVPNYYPGLRSSFTYLFTRYHKKIDEEYFKNISDILLGVKRIANEAKQAGEGKIEDGKREVSYPLYCAFNRWCMEEGSKEGIYCRAFATKTWNLASRGNSTGKIHLPHLTWRSDAYSINFAHLKDEQTGANKSKRLPRNIFANPFDPEADDYSALFDYFSVYPEILADPTGRLFPGSEEDVTGRFSKYMSIIMEKHKEELADLGYLPEDLGIHSWRKGAHTYMNNGSTAGPSATATCIRGGHTIGGSRDIYVLHARAGDTYCGRVLAGLPIHDAKFAVSYPDFSAVEENITEERLKEKQRELDEKVNNALAGIFGKNILEHVPNLIRILRIGLASHLHHRDKLDTMYPQDACIRSTAIYTSNLILDLKPKVKITLPWENGGMAYATGIPPHTAILAGNEEIKKFLRELLPAIEKFMDDRTMCGNLSETRMRQIVDANRDEVKEQLKRITEMLEKQQGLTGNVHQQGDVTIITRNGYNSWVVSGIERHLPPDWTFPSGPAIHAYQYWHHGDEVKKIIPMKMLKRSDLSHFTNAKKRYLRNFEEVKNLFVMLDQEAKAKGLWKEDLDRSDVMHIFTTCKGVFGIPELTRTKRKRNFVKMAWSTIVRERKRLKKAESGGAGTSDEDDN